MTNRIVHAPLRAARGAIGIQFSTGVSVRSAINRQVVALLEVLNSPNGVIIVIAINFAIVAKLIQTQLQGSDRITVVFGAQRFSDHRIRRGNRIAAGIGIRIGSGGVAAGVRQDGQKLRLRPASAVAVAYAIPARYAGVIQQAQNRILRSQEDASSTGNRLLAHIQAAGNRSNLAGAAIFGDGNELRNHEAAVPSVGSSKPFVLAVHSGNLQRSAVGNGSEFRRASAARSTQVQGTATNITVKSSHSKNLLYLFYLALCIAGQLSFAHL